MTENDPFDFPEVRYKTPADVAHLPPREMAQPTNGTETKNERLARLWLEAWMVKRDAEAKMTQIRKELEALLENGEMVGNSTGYLTWESSKSLKADPKGLFDAIGPQVYVRVSEVSTTKLRELIQAGVIPSEADYLRYETTKRLVTKLR